MRRAFRSGTGALFPGPFPTDNVEIVRTISFRGPFACTALATLLLLAAGFPAEAGSPSAASPGAAGKVQAIARVLPRAEVRILSQPPLVLVTAEDVRSGFVDSSSGILLEVESNLPGGILLVFERIPIHQGMFRAAEIRGLGGPVRIDSAGGWIPVLPGKGRAIFRLECRFLLGKDSVPGRYPWPYSLSARPL